MRLHSFELFEGLPAVNQALDDQKFERGQFRTTQDQYENNVRTFGRRSV